MTSLAPVPSESSTCANCSATLVADQRYCLSCGQPCSPVRLAFLDVLQSDGHSQLGLAPIGAVTPAPARYDEPAGGPAWLRRLAPLFGVLSVLLLAMIIGLLVGHWVTQGKAPSRQIVKVEGLSALNAAPAASAAGPAPTATKSAPKSTANTSASQEQKQEEAEAKAEEKKAVAPPKPVKVSSSTLSKLTNSTGKKHQQEINKIGTAPIEVP